MQAECNDLARQQADDKIDGIRRTLTRLEEGEFGLFVGVFQIGWYVKTYAHPNYESEGRRFSSPAKYVPHAVTVAQNRYHDTVTHRGRLDER